MRRSTILAALLILGAIGILVMKQKHTPEVQALSATQAVAEQEDALPVNTNQVETLTHYIIPVRKDGPAPQ